jgi:phage-related protein
MFMKDLFWVGGSKAELMEFPTDARQDAGWQLHLVQAGEDPGNGAEDEDQDEGKSCR